jgi:HSP20 family molecular chaperone IbpA
MSDTAMTKRETQAPAAGERIRQAAPFAPRVDIRETEAEVVLVADLPGVDENTVHIDLEGSELTLRGTFAPKTPEGYSLTYQEYQSGDYERTFTLADTIDRDGIRAVVKDGVLRLTLPKAQAVQARRIPVTTG